MSAGQETVGRRAEHKSDCRLSEVEPGEYWKDENGHWWVAAPVPKYDSIALFDEISTWKITEHEDGTITVTPSIFWGMGGYPNSPPEWAAAHTWHGYLTRGVWREV